VLTALRGTGGYNHLPVRAAAAIMLDRLLGEPEQNEGSPASEAADLHHEDVR
jgi:hypothetical protein